MTHIEHVYQLVCQYPGHPVAWLAWVEAGGRIENGRPVGKTAEHGFAQHHRVLDVQKRVAELVERGRVVMGELTVTTNTRAKGVWPVQRGDIQRPPKTAAAPPRTVGVGRSALAQLRRAVGE